MTGEGATDFNTAFKNWQGKTGEDVAPRPLAQAGLDAANAGDFRKAHDLWLEEALKGDPISQSYLGVLYATGQGVKRDGAEAAKWFRLSADQGNLEAQVNLGALYAQGDGVAQDDSEASRWFLKAAERGDAVAQSHLGVLYARGRGVAQDDKTAFRWFQKAAMQGEVKAQYSLGVFYDVGRGVKQNRIVACAWYTLAAENGDENSAALMAEIQNALSPEELEAYRQIVEQLRLQVDISNQ